MTHLVWKKHVKEDEYVVKPVGSIKFNHHTKRENNYHAKIITLKESETGRVIPLFANTYFMKKYYN